jgi:broad specificity phosphatase PhoE
VPEGSGAARRRPAIVHLVRHAETFADEKGGTQGGEDSPLTSAGRYRSTLLAADLHEEPLQAVYASPAGCAVDTARILVAGRGLVVGTLPGLREKATEESSAAAGERMRACVDGLLRSHRGGTFLIVSHAAALQALLESIEDRSGRDPRKAGELRPCSHSMVRGPGIEQARIVRYAGLAWPPRPLKGRRAATIPA